MRRPLLTSLVTCAALAVGLTTAHAEQITATLTFADGNTVPVPIANATVEIWRYRFRFPVWSWGNDLTTTTDAAGRLNGFVPFVGTGVVTALRVLATNPSAQVFTQDLYANPFYREPGKPGTEITRTTTGPADILDFSFNFADAWATNHFNVADMVQRGAAYAAARRDPGETDAIGQTKVLMNGIGSTYYDPVSHAIRLDVSFAMDDFTVLHEYAHALEEQISGFFGVARFNNACATVDPGYAWMEGFANYFPHAVAASLPPGVVNGPALGTASATTLESPPCPATAQPLAVENRVGAALFDLIDGNGIAEPSDVVCTSEFPADTLIFQIFDHELDIGWANPTLQQFADAWIARGAPVSALVRTFSTTSLAVATPPGVTIYDHSAAVNVAVWRPSTGVFWVSGGERPPLTWGEPGDVPVPADYDGDGLTDVAIFRPRDGTWWMILSAANRVSVLQWGAVGDVPLPADYDGDGAVDIAVYRPSTGEVGVHAGTCGVSAARFIGFGTPVVGNFDGDKKADPGIWDDANRTFTIAVPRRPLTMTMPVSGAPLVQDFDGDGRLDVAVFERATARWHVRSAATGAITVTTWGDPNAFPVPGDYDGDGRVDLATWSPVSEMWSIQRQQLVHWGEAGDVPVPAR